MKRFMLWLMQYGLMAAIFVWAMTVGMMAYRLDESPWRWAFVALAIGGLATIYGIFRIRRYVDTMARDSEEGPRS